MLLGDLSNPNTTWELNKFLITSQLAILNLQNLFFVWLSSLFDFQFKIILFLFWFEFPLNFHSSFLSNKLFIFDSTNFELALLNIKRQKFYYFLLFGSSTLFFHCLSQFVVPLISLEYAKPNIPNCYVGNYSLILVSFFQAHYKRVADTISKILRDFCLSIKL